jgi:hypothetical protein
LKKMIIILVGGLLVLWLLSNVVRMVIIPNGYSCVYRYKYFELLDDGSLGKYKSDEVDIMDERDVSLLREILNMKIAFYDFDYQSGYTDEYAIEFVSENGNRIPLEIRFGGRNGWVGVPNTHLAFQLSREQSDLFYSTLSKYHRYKPAALAG